MFITGQNDTCKSVEKMIALVVASIYEGYEANEADYADLEWKNGKGQHAWACVFKQTAVSMQDYKEYSIFSMKAGQWPYIMVFDSSSNTALMILKRLNFNNRRAQLYAGEMHYIFSGIPANSDLDQESPMYQQTSFLQPDPSLNSLIQDEFIKLENRTGTKIQRFLVLTFEADPVRVIKSCEIQLMNSHGDLIKTYNIDHLIPVRWTEESSSISITTLRPDDGKTNTKSQIDDKTVVKPKKQYIIKDGTE